MTLEEARAEVERLAKLYSDCVTEFEECKKLTNNADINLENARGLLEQAELRVRELERQEPNAGAIVTMDSKPSLEESP